MAVVRWGILSTAKIARTKVIPALQCADGCEVVAIGSRDAALAGKVAADLGIPKAYGSYEQVLDDADVDAVYVPLPNHLHAQWTVAAARAGKHVLCEKPLAMDAAEARQVVDACAAEGVTLMEAFMYRLHPSWVALRDVVTSGRIGELRAVQSWFSFFNDDRGNIRNVRTYGGGAMLDIGCYCVNSARLLFAAEPARVQASVERDRVTGVDVVASVILEFPNGTASFTCSIRTEPDQRVHVYGTEGRASIVIPFNIPPDLPTEVHVTAGGTPPVNPRTEVLTFPPTDQYVVQGELFARAVLDGTPPPTPPDDAVMNLQVIDQILSADGPPYGSDG